MKKIFSIISFILLASFACAHPQEKKLITNENIPSLHEGDVLKGEKPRFLLSVKAVDVAAYSMVIQADYQNEDFLASAFLFH